MQQLFVESKFVFLFYLDFSYTDYAIETVTFLCNFFLYILIKTILLYHFDPNGIQN